MFFRRSTSQPLSSPKEATEVSEHGDSNNDGTANEQSQVQSKGKEPQSQNHHTTNPTMNNATSQPMTPTKRRSSSLEVLVTKIRLPRNTIIARREDTKSPPDSPKSPKNQRIESSSGEDPISHPGLCESLASPQKASIIHRDTFSCSGGVNLGRLLGMTRERLLDRATEAGANCLVDEKWKCVITGPRRPRGAYKVQIYYSAFAAKLKEDLARDPHKPVALDCAQGVPGLMTILEREE